MSDGKKDLGKFYPVEWVYGSGRRRAKQHRVGGSDDSRGRNGS